MHPAPGVRGHGEGALWYVGNDGYSWSSAITGSSAHFLNFLYNGVRPQHIAYRAYGLQLRCLQG